MRDYQVAAFARHYKVIRYDVRGYGRSSVPGTEDYYHADYLLGLLDHLRIPQAHVLGLSLGAAIATELALAYPERTSGGGLPQPHSAWCDRRWVIIWISAVGAGL